MTRSSRRWWIAAVAGVFLLGGGWAWSAWREGALRERLREEIAADRDAAKAAARVREAVPSAENAAPVYDEAFAALDRSALTQGYFAALNGDWEVPPGALRNGIAANATALLLFERAVALPSMEATEEEVRRWGTGPHDLQAVVDGRLLEQARGGDAAEAFRTAGRMARMVRHLSRAPRIPYFLHADLLLSRSMEALEGGVRSPEAGPADLREALDSFPSPEEARGAFVRAASLAFGENLDLDLLGLLSPDAEAEAKARGWRSASWIDRMGAALGGKSLPPGATLPTVAEMARARDLARRYLDLAGRRGAAGFRELEAFEAAVAAADPPDFASMMFGQAGLQWRQEVLLEARLAAARTALALRLYEELRGETPADLARLVPEYLPSVPTDPFTGEPVRHDPGPGGWKVSCAPPRDFVRPGIAWNTTQVAIEWKRPR